MTQLARPARVLLASAVLLLAASTAYAVLARTPTADADGWSGPREGGAVSGECSRSLRLLPSLIAPPPGFIRLRGETFLLQGGTPVIPPGAADTRYRYRGWKLLRSGDMLYLVNMDRPEKVAGYTRGECRQRTSLTPSSSPGLPPRDRSSGDRSAPFLR